MKLYVQAGRPSFSTLPLYMLATVLVVASASLTGCGAKKATAAAPPAAAPKPAPAPVKIAAVAEPFSIPQTEVDLPRPQPVNPAAVTAPPPEQPPDVEPPVVRPPSAPVAQPPKAETPPQEVPQPSRPRVRIAESAKEQKRVQEKVDASRREVENLIARAKRRNLSGPETDLIQRIQGFLDQAVAALRSGDFQQAESLSSRALTLSRDLNP